MKYMLIIAGHEGGWEDRTPEEAKAEMGRWFAYTQELEDAGGERVQEAFVDALERSQADGDPDNPGAWIARGARNKAIDRLRRERVLAAKKPELEALEALRVSDGGPSADPAAPGGEAEEAGGIDDRLRPHFNCL